jgi:hypothetical protein
MPRRPRRRLLLLVPLLLVGLTIPLALHACAASYENRDPVGERFPTVSGRSLEEVKITLPDDYAGEPAVILVGYLQRAQFDIDRWILGLLQAGVNARIVEVPTVPGLAAGLASGWIDEGMRSGIPEEDWGSVVTLYGSSADPVAEFTGNENGRLTRVLILDADGQVVWFDDKGYSARKALDVARVVRALRN